MLKEFKEFALRGNVMDLAVGVVIGGAFGKIVSSFVNDILMPPIGLLLGRVNFTDLYLVLKGEVPAGTSLAAAKEIVGVVTWNYGSFLSAIVDFSIIAFSIFILIRAINRLQKPAPAPAPTEPTTKTCPQCCTEIPLKATRCPNCTSQL
jgi:large conductance mechanosensitive channel